MSDIAADEVKEYKTVDDIIDALNVMIPKLNEYTNDINLRMIWLGCMRIQLESMRMALLKIDCERCDNE